MCLIAWTSMVSVIPGGFVMRSVLSATLMVAGVMVAGVGAAQAQLTPPSTAGAKPKTVTTVPIRPALQKPEDTASAMAAGAAIGPCLGRRI
jgi:hypothetical protein